MEGRKWKGPLPDYKDLKLNVPPLTAGAVITDLTGDYDHSGFQPWKLQNVMGIGECESVGNRRKRTQDAASIRVYHQNRCIYGRGMDDGSP